jgi:hypothetical protein
MRSVRRRLPLLLFLPVVLMTPLPAQVNSDDAFIEELGDVHAREPVDRKRLARIFFSLSATLDGGKSSVQLLHRGVIVPDTSRQAVQSLLRARFEDYSRSLGRFKASVSRLLDEPNSRLLFYRTLVDGQRACWHFDLHNRLIEAYGSEEDMLSILSSREACLRLRRAAFQPRVEAIVMDALVEQVYQREQIQELEADLRELEQLLEDLEEIDAAP